MKNKQATLSYLFLFLGYTIFGFSFMFSKDAMNYASPFLMLGIRFIIAFLIIQGIFIIKKKKLRLKGKKIRYLLLLGLVQPTLYFIFESFGVKLLQTSYVGIILSMIPLVSFFLGNLFLNEKVKPVHILFGILSILGVAITTLGESSNDFSAIGFLLIMGSVITAALFNVFSRKIADAFDSYERTYIMFLMGAIVFSIIGLFTSINTFEVEITNIFENTQFWIDILYLSSVSSVGAFLMINYAMTHTSVAKASIFANLTTVVSIFAGVIFLSEDFGWFQLVGSVIIVFSVYRMNKAKKKKKANEVVMLS